MPEPNTITNPYTVHLSFANQIKDCLLTVFRTYYKRHRGLFKLLSQPTEKGTFVFLGRHGKHLAAPYVMNKANVIPWKV